MITKPGKYWWHPAGLSTTAYGPYNVYMYGNMMVMDYDQIATHYNRAHPIRVPIEWLPGELRNAE